MNKIGYSIHQSISKTISINKRSTNQKDQQALLVVGDLEHKPMFKAICLLLVCSNKQQFTMWPLFQGILVQEKMIWGRDFQIRDNNLLIEDKT